MVSYKPKVRELISKNDMWLGHKYFLMVTVLLEGRKKKTRGAR